MGGVREEARRGAHHEVGEEPQLLGGELAALGALPQQIVQPVPPEAPLHQHHLLQRPPVRVVEYGY